MKSRRDDVGKRLACALAGLVMSGGALAADQSESTIGPDYTRAPEFEIRAGVPVGAVHAFVLSSSDSALYPGIRRLENAVTQRRDAYGNRIAAADAEQSAPYPYLRTVWGYVPN